MAMDTRRDMKKPTTLERKSPRKKVQLLKLKRLLIVKRSQRRKRNLKRPPKRTRARAKMQTTSRETARETRRETRREKA